MLYYYLIYPFLSFGIQVWCPTYPAYLKPVTTLQNESSEYWLLPTLDHILSHCWSLSDFFDIIHLEILSFVYQWCHKLSTSCFVNYSNPLSSIHSILTYNTRQLQIDNLIVKSVHTTHYGIHSLSYTGPKFWISLSIDVKKIITSLFLVFVNISRILWLMVIIILLIANVLRLYYL